MEELKNKFVTINAHIDGAPAKSDFDIKTQSISPAAVRRGQVLVKVLYVSVDPYQLNRMKTDSICETIGVNAITPGHVRPDPIDGLGIGRVVASGRAEFGKGELVVGILTWGEYTIVEEGGTLNKLDPMGLPLHYHVGPLAYSGLAAYGGFFEVCKPKKGETVFVSTAAGSVGSLVGQYAKLFGCRVIGCAGTQQKVHLLKHELGFDDAFNYKNETDLKSTLKRYFPEGIDIYFDNVGGEMLEAAVANMNVSGRVAVCGAISEYTGTGSKTSLEITNILYKRITIQGFIAAEHLKCYADFISTTEKYIRDGKMKILCDVLHGIESVPSAFVRLFTGDNIGKMVVQFSEEQ